MRQRRYVIQAELVITISDPEPPDDNWVRILAGQVTKFVHTKADEFAWPVDWTVTQSTATVEE